MCFIISVWKCTLMPGFIVSRSSILLHFTKPCHSFILILTLSWLEEGKPSPLPHFTLRVPGKTSAWKGQLTFKVKWIKSISWDRDILVANKTLKSLGFSHGGLIQLLYLIVNCKCLFCFFYLKNLKQHFLTHQIFCKKGE